jgi:hypothetical protein
MTTVTFNEVVVHGQKSVKCSKGCGRTLRRAKKFWQTLSPFNKNKTGALKTREEITAELSVERHAWEGRPETCSHCRG